MASLLCLFHACFGAAQAQDPTSASPEAPRTERNWAGGVGVSFSASTLGLGGDVAFAVTRRTNVRAGLSAFNYSDDFRKDGVGYNAKLSLRSVRGLLDFFPLGGGFHISPGIMFYNGNKVNADTSVGGGESFDLGGTTFISSSSDPIRGAGRLNLNSVGPMFLAGFGNLVPRNGRRVAFTVEAGVVYQGSPDVRLNFTGSACDTGGTNCVNAATNPDFLSHVAAEQKNLNDDARPFRFYPVVQFEIGYRFGGGHQ